MLDFYIAPDFLSSHGSGMLAKNYNLKENFILIMRKIKIKIVKINKTILIWALYLLTHKCVKRSSNPSMVSYVALGGQQTTTVPTYKPDNNS